MAERGGEVARLDRSGKVLAPARANGIEEVLDVGGATVARELADLLARLIEGGGTDQPRDRAALTGGDDPGAEAPDLVEVIDPWLGGERPVFEDQRDLGVIVDRDVGVRSLGRI